MIKTSVYLSEVLKAELAALSRRTGQSEADVIRAAIAEYVHGARAAANAARTSRWADAPCVLVVGVGPGDVALVTDEARAALRDARRIFTFASGAGVVSRAETVVRGVLPDAPISRLPIDVFGAAGADYAAAAAELLTASQEGPIAVAVLGDPTIFSFLSPLRDALHRVAAERDEPAPDVFAVNGITAFQQLAARAGMTLADRGETLLLLAPDHASDDLDAALAAPSTTVVLSKGRRDPSSIAAAATRAGRPDDAVVGELLGLPGARLVPLHEYGTEEMSYLATVVIPAVRERP